MSVPDHSAAPVRRTVVVLGVTQTLSWASSYYLVAILAVPMARELAIAPTSVYGAFSAALLLAAVLGPRVGRTVDALGGREVLMVSNLALAAGLVLLSLAPGEITLWCAWGVMGVGMGLGLYDTAFAAATRFYGERARGPITGITLIAGFASTVGFPLTAWGEAELGWRTTCVAWAAVQLLIALPMNRFGLPKLRPAPEERAAAMTARVPWDRNMVVLGFVFCACWMVTAAMAVHLPQVLMAAGASTATAVAAAALVGPAQVAARAFEAALQTRVSAVTSLRIALLGHPLGAVALLLSGGALPFVFALLHGGGNGVLTIARGTVPLVVFGPQNYGLRSGLLGAGARIGQAFAPLLFGLLVVPLGAQALWVSTGVMLVALLAMAFLAPVRPRA